jgi:DNA helicase-2/ATP-dependent DNA helicase PcrA
LRFYDRLEVKILLDYLRIFNQPDNNDAIARVINVPSRRIGEATIKSLLEEADRSKITLWKLILDMVQGNSPTKTKLPAQTEKGLKNFVDIVLTARNKVRDTEYPFGTVELINFLVKKIDYEAWLEEHHNDVAKGRWANVEELITQASDFQDLVATGYEDESLPQVDGLDQDDQSNPLSRFLANVALASEVKGVEDEGTQTPQVTISTIHAAKGLEWPVVFIPATYQGSIPHSRSEDTCEERRLLYVAMTRAKSLLYMSYPLKSSQGEQTTLCPFLSSPSLERLVDQRGPILGTNSIQDLCHILRRSIPSTDSISRSSELLKSHEDNLFPVGDNDEEVDYNSRWKSRTENSTYMRGQQQSKRQRIKFGRSASMQEESASFKPCYVTTMNRASTFITTSMTIKSTFVSAGSLPVLSEQSVNSKRENSDVIKTSNKQKKNSADGQGTLFNFLGKAESSRDTQKPLNPTTNLCGSGSATTPEPIGISPELANHRLNMASRLRPGVRVEQNVPHKPYVFLSSSPTRPLPEPEPRAEGMTEVVKPVVRQAATYQLVLFLFYLSFKGS